MAVHKKFQLGRGLDALISTDEIKTQGSSSINEVELSKIVPNPDQPRREFDPESLQELADSIREIGIIQPITLRKIDAGQYQIIAGERRFRASQLAGLKTITAYIRTADDENVMEMALIENIQREDLNSLEIALAYQHLIEQYGLTQERLSDRVGKKRTTIANYLRLLKLPAQIQVGLQNKEIDMGHARALIALDDPKLQMKLYNDILHEKYSVRKVEELVKGLNAGESLATLKKQTAAKPKSTSDKAHADFALLREHLASYFQTPVQLTCNAQGKGKITLAFENEQDLERIIALFDKLKE
ncbi:MAG: ParB/RepB/Spo0J family partition protein [Bacteroidaceae bacterium]|jgi:ParB family chromosome partitioning protein